MFSSRCLLIRDKVNFEIYRKHHACTLKQIKGLIHQHARSRISWKKDGNQIVTHCNQLRKWVTPVWPVGKYEHFCFPDGLALLFLDYCYILLLCFIDGFSSFFNVLGDGETELFRFFSIRSCQVPSCQIQRQLRRQSPPAFDFGTQRLNLMGLNQMHF